MTLGLSAPNAIRSALYYPFPYVQNENWLKEQAIFWDHIYRIVPRGFREMEYRGQLVNPTRTESVLRDEIGFIEDCEVDESWEQFHLIGDRMDTLFGSSDWFRSETLKDEREYFTWGSLDGVKGVRFADIEHLLLTSSGAWRYFPGMVYMALLAKLLSISYGLPVVTDDAEHDLILRTEDVVTDWAGEFHQGSRAHNLGATQPDTPGDRTALLYAILLERVGCANLDDASLGKILAFRKEYNEERRDFVDEIQSLAVGLKSRTYASDEELLQYLEECANKIVRKRRIMIEAMRGYGIDAALRASAISAPLIAGAASGSLPQMGAAVGGALGITAVLYGSRRARRTDLLKDPAATYLFLLKERLDAKRHFSRLRGVKLTGPGW